MIMMPKNWNEVKEFSDRAKLPLGAYVCLVKQCRVQDTNYGSQLAILFDINEGEYKGYFNDEFTANQQQDKKWKGILRIWLPKDDGSDKDEFTKSVLKGMVTAFENSNLGFTWNWNEKSLEGKQIGILFRNEEWEYEGKSGWAVRPFRAISAASVREGKFTLPKDKPLANKSGTSYQAPAYMPPSDTNGFVVVDDDEIPF